MINHQYNLLKLFDKGIRSLIIIIKIHAHIKHYLMHILYYSLFLFIYCLAFVLIYSQGNLLEKSLAIYLCSFFINDFIILMSNLLNIRK